MKLECNLRGLASLVSCAARRAMGARGEEGSALLEFAISLPLLMMVLTGAASFSLAFYSLQQLDSATSSTVQQIAAEQGLLTDPCNTALSTLTTALPGWNGTFKYTMVITDSGGTAHTYSSTSSKGSTSFTCTAGGSEEAPNEPVVLTVTYSYTWLPIVAFSPSSPLSSNHASMAD